jgi:hypothetical protein
MTHIATGTPVNTADLDLDHLSVTVMNDVAAALVVVAVTDRLVIEIVTVTANVIVNVIVRETETVKAVIAIETGAMIADRPRLTKVHRLHWLRQQLSSLPCVRVRNP